MKKIIDGVVLGLVVAIATFLSHQAMAEDGIVVGEYMLVQGNALGLDKDTDPRNDPSVASLREVIDILDRLWEAGKGKDQPLCFREGFLRKTKAGWIFTPAIKMDLGIINVVKIPSGDQMMFWIVKQIPSALKD